MHCSRVFTSQVCPITLFAKIKFSRKFPNLQYNINNNLPINPFSEIKVPEQWVLSQNINLKIKDVAKVWGTQWLSGRVLDLRPMGHGFELHRHHWVVSLSRNINPSLVLVQPRKTLRPILCYYIIFCYNYSYCIMWAY